MTSPVFSYDIFAAQRVGGVTRCMLEMMKELPGDWRLWAPAGTNAMLDESSGPWLSPRWTRAPSRRGGRIAASLKLERHFARWFANSGASVLHRTYYPVVDLTRHCRRVVTLHDMWDEQSRDWGAPLRSWIKRRSCERADRVICVSDHTRQEMLRFWPWLGEKTVVIPHGVRSLGVSRAPTVKRPYFLFVGRRGLYKNFAIAASALVRSNLRDHSLLCFGGGGFDPDEHRIIRNLGIEDRIIQVEGGDTDLAGYYENATALLFPSSYEGFGLPLLEAMKHDCPVIASPLTSLPEVAGDAALYADATDSDAWGHAMRSVALDRTASAQLRAAGRRRAELFSWAKSAHAHRLVYEELG